MIIKILYFQVNIINCSIHIHNHCSWQPSVNYKTFEGARKLSQFLRIFNKPQKFFLLILKHKSCFQNCPLESFVIYGIIIVSRYEGLQWPHPNFQDILLHCTKSCNHDSQDTNASILPYISIVEHPECYSIIIADVWKGCNL